ncbi:NAD(P)-binding domain-containing protein [Asanoa sp. NPDC049518]|uniref:NAD(P)-binding domain-containing protein n=1 Tax=unclassified Asanoa TaxID=2685164 RepID=UPI003421965F
MTVIGILGAGNVARALAPALSAAGHDVRVGGRTALTATAAAAEVVVNALPGAVSVDTIGPLRAALAGKVLVDVSNAVEIGPDGFASRRLCPNLAQEPTGPAHRRRADQARPRGTGPLADGGGTPGRPLPGERPGKGC